MFMNVNLSGEWGKWERGACSLLAKWDGLCYFLSQQSFIFLTKHYCILVLGSIRRACAFVGTVCVTCLREKETNAGRGRGAGGGGGVNSRKADGAEGRRLMQ